MKRALFLFTGLFVLVSLLPVPMPSAALPITTQELQPPDVSPATIDQAEQQVSLSGWITIIWGDGPPGSNLATESYMLIDEHGQSTELLLNEKLVQPLGGILALNRRRVVVEGKRVSASILGARPAVLHVQSIRFDTKASALAAPEATDAVSGSQPWISILCKFADVATEPKPLSYFQGMYASTLPGLEHYWRELSYDTINLMGSNATGWYTLPQPRSYYVYDRNGDGKEDLDLSRTAEDCTAVAETDVYFPDYVGVNLMFNYGLDGYAHGGSWPLTRDGVSRTWRMTWEPSWAYRDMAVIAHEMGHSYGLPHSSGAYGETYDNQWDVMSYDRINCSLSTDPVYGCLGQHTISYHKDRLGWIPAGQKYVAIPDSQATISLEQLALPQTTNYRLLQIPIGGLGTHFYTVEVRRKVGYDIKLPGEAVIIHEVDTTRRRPAYVVDIDNNGNTGDAGAMWTVGETFSDAENGISVSVDSATTTGFVVTVINNSVPGPTLTPTSMNVDFVSQIGGSTSAVAIGGTLAYVGIGPRLVVLDVSEPASPVFVGQSVVLPDIVQGIIVSGNYAYVTTGPGGLHILNVSNPAAPTQVGVYGTPGAARGVAVAGDYAYVTTGQYGLGIINVSDPAHPTEVSFYPTWNAEGMTVVGGYAYVLDKGYKLRIISVANPAAPAEVGFYDTPDRAYGIAVAGNHAYIADNESGLRIINVANPAAPVEVGFYDTPQYAQGVAVVGNYAYVADGPRLYIIDVTNPASPTQAGFYSTPEWASGVAVVGNYAYVTHAYLGGRRVLSPANRSFGLRIINVTNPASPTQAGFYDTLVDATSVAKVGNYAYVTDEIAGLQIINVTNPAAPVNASFYDTPGFIQDVAVAGDYAYVADGNSGLRILNVTNPTSPAEVGFYDTPGFIQDVAVAGNYAYVADGNSGLRILNVANPTSPAEVGFYDTPGYAYGVAVAGECAYVADGNSGLRILNVANPAAAAEVGFYDTPDRAYGIAVAGNYAYIADNESGLRIVNVTNPAAPAEVGFYDTPERAYGITVAGDYAYIADYESGLHIVNITFPAAPAEVGFYDTPGNAGDVAIAGNYVYVANTDGGLVILHFPSRDLNGDGTITIADVQTVANAWRTFDLSYDLDSDWRVTIADIMIVAGAIQ